MPSKPRLGLIANPVAGIGGRVGLKGSDTPQIQRLARRLGARPEAGERALRFARRLLVDFDEEVLVAPGRMGEIAVRSVGGRTITVGTSHRGPTTADDTKRAAAAMVEQGADIIAFVGGDGTARDIVDAVGQRVTALGIAAGVKVYSAVFAVSPERGAATTLSYLAGRLATEEAEVLDLDEEGYRRGEVSPRLYGYLRTPRERAALQGAKTPTPASEVSTIEAIAAEVVERMAPDGVYVLGPGTTTRGVARALNLPKTLAGVDVVSRSGVVIPDVSEQQLLAIAAGRIDGIVITPIGGQGFVFGRGNLQISPRVLRAVARDRLIIVATPAKLAALAGRPLRSDTGDPELDADLSGYYHVITGYHEATPYRLEG